MCKDCMKKLISSFSLQKGGSISRMGYKDNSPYRNAKSLMINSPNGLITMDGVSQDLIGVDEFGNKQYMKANSGNYQFKGKNITEYPIKQEGGQIGSMVGMGLGLASSFLGVPPQVGMQVGSQLGGMVGNQISPPQQQMQPQMQQMPIQNQQQMQPLAKRGRKLINYKLFK